MKKIIISLTLIAVILLNFVGCYSKTEDLSETGTTKDEVSVTATEAKKPERQTYSKIGGYHEGLAWVQYGENDEYWGCIDEEGKMLFKYSCNDLRQIDSFVSPFFENGYAYMKSNTGTRIFVIDKSGNIVSNYDNPKAYGYGYTVVENHYSDFDSAYYEYIIYNPDGKQVETIETEVDSEVTVKYCGDGVFYFEANSEQVYLFFAKKEKWVQYNYKRTNVDYDIRFNNGLAFTVNDSYSFTKTYVVIDSNGTITEIDARDESANFYEKYKMFGAERENNLIYGNSIVFYDEEEPKLSSYDIKNDSFCDFKDTKTLEKFETHYAGSYSHVDISPSFNNEGFLVSLVGADGYRYVSILDYKLNMQAKPVKGDNFEAYDNSTCLIGNTIYDMKGNILYSLSEKGYQKVISDSDDIIFVCGYQDDVSVEKDYYDKNGEKCNFAALDRNGNVLFDTIDVSNAESKRIY